MKKLIILIIFITSTTAVIAQSGENITVRDLETWTSAGISYKVNKRLKINLSQQFRLNNNATNLDEYFTQLRLKYEFKNGLYFGGGYRFIKENDRQGEVQGIETHTRWQTDLGYSHKVKRLELLYRIRFQRKNELNISGTNQNAVFRTKIGVGYNIKKWKLDPVVSAEIFRSTTDNEFSKIRFTAGTEYKLKKAGKIEAFYRFEKELNEVNPLSSNILGLQYTYTIKNKSK